MDKFTASNGFTVRERGEGKGLSFVSKDSYDMGAITGVTEEQADALREFFRAEDDEELGRWRYPADPRYVVYPPDEDDEDRAILILFEPGGGSSRVTRDWLDRVIDPEKWAYAACAMAYFDAHPEPKPWESAKTGEVWLLTVDGREMAMIRDVGVDFFGTGTDYRLVRYDSPTITAATRIYPKEEA